MTAYDYVKHAHWFFIILFQIGFWGLRYRLQYQSMRPTERVLHPCGCLMLASFVSLIVVLFIQMNPQWIQR